MEGQATPDRHGGLSLRACCEFSYAVLRVVHEPPSLAVGCR